MNGLGQAAMIYDLDEAGYIGGDAGIAVQQARGRLAAYCSGLAAEYLHVAPVAAIAKSKLRMNVREIEAELDTHKFTHDEQALWDRFIYDVDQAIDRLSSKSPRQRTLALWIFRTPQWVMILGMISTIFLLSIAAGKLIH